MLSEVEASVRLFTNRCFDYAQHDIEKTKSSTTNTVSALLSHPKTLHHYLSTAIV